MATQVGSDRLWAVAYPFSSGDWFVIESTIRRTRRGAIRAMVEEGIQCEPPCDWAYFKRLGAKCVRVTVAVKAPGGMPPAG